MKSKKNFFVSKTCSLMGLLLMAGVFLLSSCSKKEVLHVYGSGNNELVTLLQKQSALKLVVHQDLNQLVEKSKKGEGVLVLAENYPKQQVELPGNFYTALKEKEVHFFVEFPSFLPNNKVEEIGKAGHERAVVSSNFFGSLPDSLTILGLNGLHFLKIEGFPANEHLVAVRVAGFDEAIYGLPQQQYPLLYEEEGGLLCTTNLSKFIAGRYAPKKEWAGIWKRIITYLLPDVQLSELEWTPVVQATYTKEEKLPEDAYRTAVERGVEWYIDGKLLVPASYEDSISKLAEEDKLIMGWSEDIPKGDGTHGVFECIFSDISADGTQPINIIRRGDCISETSMAFATVGTLLNKEEYKTIAQNLLDYYLFESPALKGEYGDPNHPAFGLIPWGITNYTWYKASYGDDNARFFLAAWTTAALLQTDRWDELLMRSLMGLLRTTGENGFRGSRIDLPHFEEKKGWKYYEQQEIVHLSPHFESYLWGCFLWAYDKCGDERFLTKAKNGLKLMMENYTDGWNWTNGLAQERARIVLPLSWLVRVEDTEENRALLHKAVKGLLSIQDECGAIQEELGNLAKGYYPPPQSNEAYGTTEASLIAKNGDKVSDLLYTTNFAFLGLNEAYHATKDEYIKEGLEKLGDFLCRIQVDAPTHPELDGGWMRAFDFDRFEHWASNSDAGWGAWAIETGWTQGWIVGVLSLMQMDQSIWDLTKESKINVHYDKIEKMMYPKK